MRTAAIGASTLVAMIAAAWLLSAGTSPGYAQRPAPQGSSAGLVTVSSPAGENRQQITLIDPETLSMAVYHIDVTKGEIVLKSVRNLRYDLQMIEFNGTSPLPGEIRAILEQ